MIYYTKNPECKKVKPSQKHHLMLIFVTGFMKTDHNVTRTEIQIMYDSLMHRPRTSTAWL